jgi:hypothetical protein
MSRSRPNSHASRPKDGLDLLGPLAVTALENNDPAERAAANRALVAILIWLKPAVDAEIERRRRLGTWPESLTPGN